MKKQGPKNSCLFHMTINIISDRRRMDGYTIPTYQVSQDANHVYVDVSCQSPATAQPKVAVEGRIFGFYLDGYYLPLVLPGPARDGGEAVRAMHDDSGGQRIRIALDKVSPGEHFDGLETIQPQLLPEDQLRQALSDAEHRRGFFGHSQGEGVSAGNDQAVDEAAKALLRQAIKSHGLTTMEDEDGEAAVDVAQAASSSSARGGGFGFGWKNSFKGTLIPAGCADTRNVLEVSDPDSIPPTEREQIAVAFEEEHWDEGIYMDNFLDIDGELSHALEFQPSIPSLTNSSMASSGGANIDVEALALLLQLLFAYSYDERTNDGEATVESGWTIAKLSRSLAASTSPRSPPDAPLESVVAATLIGCVRRALTVPLYRHWQLAQTCIDDTVARLGAGETYIRTCLVAIASRLESGGDAILCRLSEVWVAPLMAHLPDQAQLDALSTSVSKAREDAITKDQVGGEAWDLQVAEEAAKLAFEQGEGGFV